LLIYEIRLATSDDTYYFLRYAVRFLMEHAEQCDAESAQEDLLAFLGWPSETEAFIQSLDTAGELYLWNQSGSTLVHVVSEGGAAKLLTAMLRNTEGATACIDATDNDGRTPLSFAAEAGHLAVVKVLLDTGEVDVSMEDRMGWSPFFWAVKRGHTTIAKLLLGTGKVDVGIKDHFGQTALSRAAEGGHTAITKLLLGTGKVDVGIKDDSGWTALSRAAAKGHESIVKLLEAAK
jgi:ankyrin repeat protein